MAALSFLHSQLFVTPPVPTRDFTGQAIIVTGGNRGLGYEAARHLLGLNAARVILAVRSVSSGRTAKETLEADTGRGDAVSVYEIDMASHISVQEFVTKMKTLARIDAVLLNAGIFTQDFVLQEGYESILIVNVLNTFLLAALLVPVLNDPMRAQMGQRYPVSKLLQILPARAMANRLVDMAGKPVIIVNSFTPGYTHSGLMNNTHGVTAWAGPLLAKAVARKTEVGARTLVAAVAMRRIAMGSI